MSGSKYLFVSLPASISRSHDPDEAFNAVQAVIGADGAVSHFPIPEFKIGTLDGLVTQADELAKLDANVEGAVAKIVDVLRNIVPGKEEDHKTVNDKPVENYLRSFSWNKVKYRSDKAIGEILSGIQKEVGAIDNDMKTKYSQYQQVKTNLVSVQRKQTGNLTTRNLAPLVNKDDFVPSSEYLETTLIVVPKSAQKEWLSSYETLAPMVVPRSSKKLTEDSEYALYNVTVFKKHMSDFLSKARASKFTPRDFKWSEHAAQVDEREARDIEAAERRLFGDTLRLAHTGYSDLFAASMHVKALRVFVESVLRYGLPLEFVSVVVKTTQKQAKRVKTNLDSAYGYLGGNAFGRDKKGKIKDDVGDMSAGMAGMNLGEGYTAYCYFELDVV